MEETKKGLDFHDRERLMMGKLKYEHDEMMAKGLIETYYRR